MTSIWRILAVMGALAPSLPARGQAATQPATQPAGDMVTLDFPPDGVELKVLADIVIRRLGIPILYDETINNKRVIVRVPRDVPESALLGILQSALKMKQMAMIDAEQPGWKQIVPATNLAAVARAPGTGDGGAITQVISLRNADPTRVQEVIRPFLTQPGGNAQVVTGQRAVVVSDYGSVIRRIEQIVQLLDADAPPVETHAIQLKQTEASAVVPVVTQIIGSRDLYQFGAANASGIFVAADERTNQVIVVAPPARAAEVVKLIEGMDQVKLVETKVFRLKALSPERLDKLVKNLLSPTAKRSYSSTVDVESHALVVAAGGDVQAQVADLVRELDVPATEEQSPIRFYKLKNTKALDVLTTISGLSAEGGLDEGSPAAEGQVADENARTMAATGSGNASADPGAPARPAEPPSVVQTRDLTSRQRTDARAPQGTDAAMSRYGGAASGIDAASPSSAGAAGATVKTRNATVAADVNTNAIIVIAPPSVQQMYAELIKKLDERRPQVQIEVTIVTLDTSDNFTFGVDIAKLGTSGDNQILGFSSFGISTLDPATGTLTPTGGLGGTFALLSPGNADIVLRAFANSSRTRLVSAPQLLVNDNGKGKLQSVSQEPFAEILDTSSTQSRTGLGGQAQAGTTIVLEPHISEGDYLQLTYSIELSAFTGESRRGLPPPSQKNAVDSTVTIPDGYTIVVGGLTVQSLRTSENSIPFIRHIPVLKYLFGTRSRTASDRTLFVFIRPMVLRDDRFEDLKYISDRAARTADLAADYPESRPIPLR